MKKLLLVSLLALTAPLIAGCSKKGSSEEDDGLITVNFYLDYNCITSGEVYHTYKIENYSKLTAPTAPKNSDFTEFPAEFKGWSNRELVYNTGYLWDFDNDIMVVPEGYKTFNMFGIWFAKE